jgi:hypothetical protein
MLVGAIIYFLAIYILFFYSTVAMIYRTIYVTIVLLFSFFASIHAQEMELFLRDNLRKANPGDFVVTLQNKSCTLLHIQEKTERSLIVEEITIPENKLPSRRTSWSEWVERGAPRNSSWLIYEIDLDTAKFGRTYSFTKGSWCEFCGADAFLTTLLTLRFTKIPSDQRKRVGASAKDYEAPLWQPRMVFEGNVIEGVAFDAWQAEWPADGSLLAGRTIEAYTPEENQHYPSYFPNWIEVSGMMGKAKVRIIDSGKGLISPKRGFPH